MFPNFFFTKTISSRSPLIIQEKSAPPNFFWKKSLPSCGWSRSGYSINFCNLLDNLMRYRSSSPTDFFLLLHSRSLSVSWYEIQKKNWGSPTFFPHFRPPFLDILYRKYKGKSYKKYIPYSLKFSAPSNFRPGVAEN